MSFIILNQLQLLKTPILHSVFIIISLLSTGHTYARDGYSLQISAQNTSLEATDRNKKLDTSEVISTSAKSNSTVHFTKGNIITAISILLVLVLLIRALKIKRKKIF